MQSIDEQHKAAQYYLSNGQLSKALQILTTLLSEEPNNADAHFLSGICYFELRHINKAINSISDAIDLNSTDEYKAYLAKCFAVKGDRINTAKWAEKVSLENSNSARILDTVGVSLSHVEAHTKALKYFEKALQLNPNLAAVHYNYGVSCTFLGEKEKARKSLEKVIQLQPAHIHAHFALADLGGVTKENNHIGRLNKLIASTKQPDALLQLHHALAKEYEELKEYKLAFQTLEKGKSQKRKTIPYQFSDQLTHFQHVKEFAKKPLELRGGCQSKEPIFIVGMPRSGTTLVDRILSSHSDVMSAGELQDFGMAVKELSQTSSNHVLDIATLDTAENLDHKKLGEYYLEKTRIVTGKNKHFIDKLPFNFFYLRQIFQALPHAKVICLMRNPLDTCIGNFRQLFSINNPYYQYSLDLKTTGSFYSEYWHLVQTWKQQQVNNLYVLTYEDLVNSPTVQIPKLLNFCGLDWQEDCLKFEKNTAAVSTASALQVRQPLSAKYLNRWKKFEDECAELIELLANNNVEFNI